jgi:hypothetical protein
MKKKITTRKGLKLDKEAIAKLQETQIAHIRGGSVPTNQNSWYVNSCTGTGTGTTQSCNENSCSKEEA